METDLPGVIDDMMVSEEMAEHLLDSVKTRVKRKVIDFSKRPASKWSNPIAVVIDKDKYTGKL